MNPYRYAMVRNIYFGDGVSKQTGTIVADEGIKKALIVTDKFLYENGIIDGIMKSLEDAGVEYKVYSDVRPNPLMSNVLACLDMMKEFGGEAVIGIGGGSSIDCGKAVAMLMTNPLPREQYVGKDLVPNYGLPLFTVPTTAGTGSECTSGSIIVDDATGKKSGVLSKKVLATAAIVDPLLLISLPPGMTAATGMDALSHAIEAYTNINATELSDMWSFKAIELLAKSLRKAYYKGSDIDARRDVSLASTCAGMALLGAGCAGGHCLAYAIETKYHAVHGLANATILPYVMKYNAPSNIEKYAKIAALFGVNVDSMSKYDAALAAADCVMQLIKDLGISTSISAYGVVEEDLEAFTEEAFANKRLRPQNPRYLTKEAIMAIYKEAL